MGGSVVAETRCKTRAPARWLQRVVPWVMLCERPHGPGWIRPVGLLAEVDVAGDEDAGAVSDASPLGVQHRVVGREVALRLQRSPKLAM